MSSKPALDFVVLYVSDLEESFKYFTQTLGLEHLADQDTTVFRGFSGGEKGIPFGIVQASEYTSRAGAIEIYLKTDNLEGLHARLAQEGVRTTEIAPRPFGSIFTVPTPDGHIVTMLKEPDTM
jgi:catechol 2,3-dioxygenase-like lactoylglutathione lyase family enzyme